MVCSICEGLKTLHTKTSDVAEKVVHLSAIDNSRQNGCEGCEIIYKTIQVSTTAWDSIATITLYLVDFVHFFLHYKESDVRTEEVTGEMIYPMSRTETPWAAIKVERDSDWTPPTLTTSIPWIKNWLLHCDQNHRPCKTVPERCSVPTRLLDVGSTCTEPRLHITRGKFVQYIALSHCWGAPGHGNGRISTTNENFTKNCGGIPYNQFPRTFQDAIEVTRELGLKYLWIDCLCIIQNSPQDWNYEAGRMADVYQNSYITLAADYAAHPGEGLFLADLAQSPGTRSFQQANPLTGEILQIFARRPIFFDEIHSYHSVIEEGCHSAERLSMLDPRAWALQERILPPRLVHFTNTELLWECRQSYFCDCGHHPGKVTLKKTFDEEMYDIPEVHRLQGPFGLDYLWEEFVKELTERNLTFATDRLPAASGIAKLISTSESFKMGRYLAGHWEKDLASSLFWSNVSSRYDLRIESSTTAEDDLLELEKLLCDRNFSYRIPGRYAPTWSWASVSASICFEYANSLVLDDCITGISCTPSTSNPYGSVQDAWLEIEGALLAIQVNRKLERREGREGAKSTITVVLVAQLESQRTIEGTISSDAGICSAEMRDSSAKYSVFFPGRLGTPSEHSLLRGFVLKEVSGHNLPTFIRVGTVRFYPWDIKQQEEALKIRARIRIV